MANIKAKGSEVIELGDRVKDKITGFTGIAQAKTEWLYGCIRFTIAPEATKDGKVPDNHTFDAEQLEVVKKQVIAHNAAVAAKVAAPAGRTYGERDDKQALSR